AGARAAAADAGRAGAAAVVGALEDKFTGVSPPRILRTQLEADSPDIPISAAQEVMGRFAATSEGEAGEAGDAGEAGKAGAGVADVDLSVPVRRSWRDTFAVKELQKEKEKEREDRREERRVAEARKRTAVQRERATVAELRPAERAVGNTRVEAERGPVVSSERAGLVGTELQRDKECGERGVAKRAVVEQRKVEEEKRVQEEQAKVAERAERAAVEQRKKAEEEKRVREE
ncbi:unnamed protein product, partial [Closterium sp. NIES-53]